MSIKFLSDLKVRWNVVLGVAVVVLLLLGYKMAVIHKDYFVQSATSNNSVQYINQSTTSNNSVQYIIQSTTSNNLPKHFIPMCYRDVNELAQNVSDKRRRLTVTCDGSEAKVFKEEVNKEDGVSSLSWKNNLECLKTFINKYCYKNVKQVIPNIVHFVWIGHIKLTAIHFVTMLSAVRFQQPCAILIHGPEQPLGPYWTLLLSIAPNILHIQREAPSSIYGKIFRNVEHKADILRLEILYAIGGIYMDTDQILLRDINELLNESVVMGHESANNMANSMILAQPGAQFLQIWHQEYKSFNPEVWGHHSTRVPCILAKTYPHLIKDVGNRFINVDGSILQKVFHSHHSLSTNYALHYYPRLFPHLKFDLPGVTTWKTTLGDIWRTVLYNSSAEFSCPKRGK